MSQALTLCVGLKELPDSPVENGDSDSNLQEQTGALVHGVYNEPSQATIGTHDLLPVSKSSPLRFGEHRDADQDAVLAATLEDDPTVTSDAPLHDLI
jgi:hypothetical protein